MVSKKDMPRIHPDDGPNPVDTLVGSKVKMRRLMLGLSQEELAKSIGLTFQQIQKYERGTNRISVSRLVDISRALKTPLDYFLENTQNLIGTQPQKTALRGVSDVKQAPLDMEQMSKKDVRELVRAYQNIKSPQLKKQLLEMAKTMASSGSEG